MLGLRRVYRANVGASAAVRAERGVDDINTIAFGNSLYLAFRLTGAAGNTIRIDAIGHY